MKCTLALFLAIAVASISSNASFPNRDGNGMKSAVRQGVRKFLLQSPDFFNIPDSVQQQIEETVVDHVAGRLLTRFRQIDAVLDGSFRIAKDFIEKSFHDAALMSRWPKEQMTAQLQSIAAETEEKVLILHLSAGLVQPTSSGRNSALDLDNIISNIIAMLMQDPTFLGLLDWLKTLPTSLHQIFDNLFANKTFQEIFAMLGAGGSNSGDASNKMLMDIMEDVLPPVDPAGTPKAVNPLAFRLVQAGLTEAQPTVELILKAYRQLLVQHIEELNEMVQEQQLKMPFIDQDVFDYIKTSAIHLMN